MGVKKIGLGGGCHWCTEGVFNSLSGVLKVEQGWISSVVPNDTFSEAIIAHYDLHEISLSTLIQIHLHTHASTSMHSMREKYRSAIYIFDEADFRLAEGIVQQLFSEFDEPIITQILPFVDFKASPAKYQDYFSKHENAPFCQTYIRPKIGLLKTQFSRHLKQTKLDE